MVSTVVSQHEACRAVLRDSVVFSAGNGAPGDGHLHRRHCAYHALSPRSRAIALEPTMRAIARDLVAGLPAGRCDLVSQLAAPYASAVLGAYFGLPEPAWRDYRDRWVAELRPPGGHPRVVTGPVTEMIRRASVGRAREPFVAALRAELARRRQAPRDDVLTALASAADMDADYTDEETLRIIPTLANNAWLGLADLAGAVLWQLLANRWLVDEIAGDERVLAGAIEEILRLEPPVQRVERRTAVPVTLGGTPVPAGTPVLVSLAAANRDDAVFPAPDRLDPARPNAGDHLSFGDGVDYCIGAPLVRRAVAVLARAFLARSGTVRLDDGAPVRHWDNPFNRGLQRLDVCIEG